MLIKVYRVSFHLNRQKLPVKTLTSFYAEKLEIDTTGYAKFHNCVYRKNLPKLTCRESLTNPCTQELKIY